MENHKEKKFFIIMGKPGSGKGTQAALFKAYLEKDHREVMHVTTGGSFRDFMKGTSFAARRTTEVQNTGLLQPEFLAIWNWSNILLNNLKDETTVILDGAPRKPLELEAMHGVFPFLQYGKPYILHVKVGDTWAIEKQLHRATIEQRPDSSSEEKVRERLKEYDKFIVPCLEMLEKDSRYTYIEINGEQTIEEVHAELVKKFEEATK